MGEATNRTLCRGLAILELLSEHPDGLTLHQIATEMKLPKSSAFNLVHTLHDLKYLHYIAESQRYQLGLRMYEVGSAAVNHLDISTVMRQYMSEILRELNETVHCGLFEGGDILYIDKLEGTRSIRMTSRVGVRMPLYCTAMGKAILAALDDDQVSALCGEGPLQPYTANTVADTGTLFEQLNRVRALGYAVEREENNENVCCVGVAIRNRDMRPQYAMSISMPSFRFDGETERGCSGLLLRAQRKIERVLRAL